MLNQWRWNVVFGVHEVKSHYCCIPVCSFFSLWWSWCTPGHSHFSFRYTHYQLVVLDHVKFKRNSFYRTKGSCQHLAKNDHDLRVNLQIKFCVEFKPRTKNLTEGKKNSVDLPFHDSQNYVVPSLFECSLVSITWHCSFIWKSSSISPCTFSKMARHVF